MMKWNPTGSLLTLMVVAMLMVWGCAGEYSATLAPGALVRGYPHDAPMLGSVDIQVFRDGPVIEIANHTAVAYSDVDVWLNERYKCRVSGLVPGGTVRLSLFDFEDQFGQPFRGGGLFAKYRSESLVKAEIDMVDGSGLVGMIVIPEPEY